MISVTLYALVFYDARLYADMGLQGQDHPRLELLMTSGNEVGLLLMPPGAHTMTDE